MKVFISWSKNSREVGKSVSNAVKEVFAPAVDTFISQEIYAGARALNLIEEELNTTDFGIICLTRSNQTEQWINYEAGALSRQLGDKRERMGVLMIDMDEPSEVNSPLNIFQCKPATPQGFADLMTSLNLLGPNIDASILASRITAAWPKVAAEVESVRNTDPDAKPPAKTLETKVDELLELIKSIDGAVSDEVSLAQRQSRKRHDNFLVEVGKLLPKQTKMSMLQIAQDLEIVNIDATVGPELEKRIQQIHRHIVGRFEDIKVSVIDENFHPTGY